MSFESLTGLITGSVGVVAVLGIVLGLLVTGVLHTGKEFDREVARGDKLELALAEKDKALEVAMSRADAAVQSAELITRAFTDAKERRQGRGRGA